MAERILVTSPLTNRIYLTKVKEDERNPSVLISIGEKQDYTDEAIKAVFEWFINNINKSNSNDIYEVSFDKSPYVLSMKKKLTIHEEGEKIKCLKKNT